MKLSRILSGVILCAVLSTQTASANKIYAEKSKAIAVLSGQYLKALEAQQLSTIEQFLHPKITYKNATVNQVVGASDTQQGKPAAMAALNQMFQHRKLKFEIQHAVYSGDYGVLNGVLHEQMDSAQQANKVTWPFTMILRVEDGKIVSHEDIVDRRNLPTRK